MLPTRRPNRARLSDKPHGRWHTGHLCSADTVAILVYFRYDARMKAAILVVTHYSTTHFCLDLLRSLESVHYPIVVTINEAEKCDAILDMAFLRYLAEKQIETIPIEGNRWEIGGLTAALICTSYDEFILIQDTLEIRDSNIFDLLFAHEGYSVAFGPGWLCYLGKYRRDILNRLMLPVVLTKLDAFYQEVHFGQYYNMVAADVEKREPIVLFPQWGNDNPANTYETHFGRENIVLDNPYVIKRKSLSWAPVGPFNSTILHYKG